MNFAPNSSRASLFLAGTGWLAGLPPPLREALLGVARLKRYGAGERVYGLGDPPGGVCGVEEGCIALEAAQSVNPPQKNYLAHPGTWFGEGPVAGLEARSTGAWATRPSTVLSIEITAFRCVAAQTPDLWRHLALLALENQRRVIGLAQDLMLRGSRQRLAALLVRQAGMRDGYRASPAPIDATQSEIAAIANLSRGVVSQLLIEMEQQGLVALRRASVEIRDPDRLLRWTETE